MSLAVSVTGPLGLLHKKIEDKSLLNASLLWVIARSQGLIGTRYYIPHCRANKRTASVQVSG